ncbi:MAG TPA: site-2 protease family protein [Methanothrix sp.]|nr:site-2 protease family protein [Methanothrix sp.]HRW82539.1 site-2 protease family protein [Methanothrix sp.]
MEFSLELTIYDWLLIAILALNLHWVLAVRLSRVRGFGGLNIGNWGPVIMIRTNRWLGLIDRLSGPKRFWRLAITAGIPLVVLGMFSFLAFFLLTTLAVMRAPPEPSVYTAPRNVLLIPGINQFIPWFAWIALFVTMAVHEFSHGILCRAEGIRVKSMGIALLIAPVAAFVEPDEEELFGSEDKRAKATRAARVRILSAGVIANFVVAALALALFFGPVIGAIAPVDRVVVVDVAPGSDADLAGFEEQMILLEADGVQIENLDGLIGNEGGPTRLKLLRGDETETVDLDAEGPLRRGVVVSYVFDGSAAEEAGMVSGVTISEIDGVPTPDWNSFRSFMNGTREGETVAIGTNRGEYRVNLTANPDGSGTGFIGVGFFWGSANAVYFDGATFQEFPAGPFLASLQEMPRSGLDGLISFMFLPFSGISGFTEMGFPGFSGWITQLYEPTGWAEPLGGKIFWLANFLFWVGLINLYAGLFNCLPAVPLDGGHIFRDLLHMGFAAIFKNEARAERMTRAVVATMAWLIFSSLIFIIVAPYLAHGFGG